jgi:spore coat protein U-like protein
MILRLAVLLALLLPAGRAEAACVLCTCTATAVTLDFGVYVPTSALATDGVGAVRVRCSLIGTGALPVLVSYDLGLSAGRSGSTAQREMRGSGHRLDYNLYSDSARSQVWGEAGTADQVTVSYGTALFGTWVQTDIYGRITARQNVKAASYTDTITVTVSY